MKNWMVLDDSDRSQKCHECGASDFRRYYGPYTEQEAKAIVAENVDAWLEAIELTAFVKTIPATVSVAMIEGGQGDGR